MTHADYTRHIDKFMAHMKSITAAKNADYTACTGDALHNFKEAARRSDITPMKAWHVLITKQMLAIERYVKAGSVMSESIHERFIDLANFSMLGDALVLDLAAAANTQGASSHADAS